MSSIEFKVLGFKPFDKATMSYRVALLIDWGSYE
jgi:hypothetical protein